MAPSSILGRLTRALSSASRATTLIILAAATIMGMTAVVSGFGLGAERQAQMWRDTIRSRSATGNLALVEIDARSLAALDHWPWPRSYHALAIDALGRAGAQAIGFDVEFSARSTPRQDAALAKAIRESSVPVILPTFLQSASQGGHNILENLPLPPFRKSAQLASVNIFADGDGLVRSYPTGTAIAGVPRPSMGAALAASNGQIGSVFPIDGAISPSTIPRVSFIDLLTGKYPPGLLRGRSVLIGATAIEMGDRYPVPRHGVIPGAVIQLLAAETLLQGSSPVPHGPLLPLFLSLLSIPFLLRLPGKRRVIGFMGASLALAALPLIAEMAKLGSVGIVPAEVALVTAAMLSIAASALRSARRSRIYDAATGLPNRRALDEILSDKAGCSLIALRIANHGEVVGVMGQDRAAELVLRISERLAVASAAEIYRIEDSAVAWVIEFEDAADQVDAIDAAAAFMRAPFEIGGRQVELSYAFGIVKLDPAQEKDLVGCALLASDRAVARGERWERYSDELDRESDWRLSIASELDRALAAGDIRVVYQPKYSLHTDHIISAEALVRWNHPTRGLIPPDSFIPILEEGGKIMDLTLYVMERALQDLQAWQRAGLKAGVAVNVSALLPADPMFAKQVKTLLTHYAVAPHTLTLEVTESIAMSNQDAAIPALEGLAELGIDLSIDDYGTGQSTLSYLKHLPAREIKIDKSFILMLESNRSDQAMVRSTIELAHELGFKVVAEGVETAEILDLLRSYGCDVAQGWHIGRPMPAADFAALASNGALKAA